MLLESIGKHASSRVADFFKPMTFKSMPVSRCVLVKSRFGEFMFDPDRIVALPAGLPGFPHAKSFAMRPFDQQRFQPFQLLQILEDEALSFLALAFDRDNPLIDVPDCNAAAQACGVNHAQFGVVLIASLRRSSSGPKLSLNLRAPIILDLNARCAWQHVLADEKYPIRHFL